MFYVKKFKTMIAKKSDFCLKKNLKLINVAIYIRLGKQNLN